MASKHEQRFGLFAGYNWRIVLARFNDAVSRMDRDKDWEIVLRPKVRRRSLDQNALFHAIINDLASETGHSPAELKEEIKGSLGLKIPVIGLDGQLREINKPTESYELEEMTALITRLLALADSLDLDVAHHREEIRRHGAKD